MQTHTTQWWIQDFPWGHGPVGGHGPLTWVLFGKNICENERIGSHRGGVRRARPLDPPMQQMVCIILKKSDLHVTLRS